MTKNVYEMQKQWPFIQCRPPTITFAYQVTSLKVTRHNCSKLGTLTMRLSNNNISKLLKNTPYYIFNVGTRRWDGLAYLWTIYLSSFSPQEFQQFCLLLWCSFSILRARVVLRMDTIVCVWLIDWWVESLILDCTAELVFHPNDKNRFCDVTVIGNGLLVFCRIVLYQ